MNTPSIPEWEERWNEVSPIGNKDDNEYVRDFIKSVEAAAEENVYKKHGLDMTRAHPGYIKESIKLALAQQTATLITDERARTREEGYEAGLNLRKEYNDPKLLEKLVKQDRATLITAVEKMNTVRDKVNGELNCPCGICYSGREKEEEIKDAVLTLLKAPKEVNK
jgi:hypothetical protein